MHFLDVIWNLKVEFFYIRVEFSSKPWPARSIARSLPTQDVTNTDNTGTFSHEARIRAVEDDMRRTISVAGRNTSLICVVQPVPFIRTEMFK
jgi:hypothetical protein